MQKHIAIVNITRLGFDTDHFSSILYSIARKDSIVTDTVKQTIIFTQYLLWPGHVTARHTIEADELPTMYCRISDVGTDQTIDNRLYCADIISQRGITNGMF